MRKLKESFSKFFLINVFGLVNGDFYKTCEKVSILAILITE